MSESPQGPAVERAPIADALADGSKARDYWWTVIVVDPIARPIARAIARRRMLTPDQVTWISLVFGAPTGLAYGFGTRWGFIAGALLFFVSFVLDCVDGKLARALKTSSPQGKLIDELADGFRRSSASAGIAFGLWRAGESPEFWWAVAYGFLATYFALVSGGTREDPGSELGGRWASFAARHRLLPTPGTPDAAAIVFVLGPLFDVVVPALIVGSAMVVVAILLTFRKAFGGG